MMSLLPIPTKPVQVLERSVRKLEGWIRAFTGVYPPENPTPSVIVYERRTLVPSPPTRRKILALMVITGTLALGIGIGAFATHWNVPSTPPVPPPMVVVQQ